MVAAIKDLKKSDSNNSIIRNAAVLLLLTAMVAVAEATGQREVVFPEAAALGVGLWLMPKAVWSVRWWHIPLLLVAAAFIGLGLNMLPVFFEVRFLLAFVLAMTMLRLARCNMYPAVSAAMLPVLVGTTSWVYPLSVLVIALVLVAGQRLMQQEQRIEYHPFSFMQFAFLFIALAVPLAIMLAVNTPTIHFLVVPPLVVTMIEFAGRRSGFRERPWTIWVMLLCASVLGTMARYLLSILCSLSMAVGTLVAVALMLLLFRRLKPFAPALAIAVVPMLLPTEVLLWFPLLVAAGAAWFILAGMFLSRKTEKKSVSSTAQ